jgi:hypothetical protein
MERIGLIAGNGKFPLIFAKAARERNISIAAVAVKEETNPELEKYVDSIYWIGVGELGRLLKILRQQRVKKMVMAGQIKPGHLFSNDVFMDNMLKTFLKRVKDKKADSLLGEIARYLKRMGIKLLDSTTFIAHLLVDRGVLTKKSPSPHQLQDIKFGRQIAKAIADADIGQTVVVKDKAVLAVEAIEGTDAAIKRGATLGRGGVVVVKTSKPRQDMRFDVPVVGRGTVQTLVDSGGGVVALEAKKVLFLEQGQALKLADTHQICIVGY